MEKLPGGRQIVTAVIRLFLPTKGAKLATGISSCFWIIVFAAGLTYRIWWLTVFSIALLVANLRLLFASDESQEALEHWNLASMAWQEQDWQGVIRGFHATAANARSTQLQNRALEWLTRAYLELGYRHRAKTVFDSIPKNHRVDPDLKQEIVVSNLFIQEAMARNSEDWGALIATCQTIKDTTDDEDTKHWAIRQIVWNLLKQDQLSEAGQLSRELAPPDPKLAAMLELGDLARPVLSAWDANDWAGVIAAAQDILDHSEGQPGRCWALEFLAWAHLRRHDWQAAEDAINKIETTQTPDDDLVNALHVGPFLANASSCQDHEDYQATVEYSSIALDCATSNELRAKAYRYLAWAHLLSGEIGKARQTIDSMPAELRPDPSLLGALLIEEDKPADALDHLEEALFRGKDISASSCWVEAIEKTQEFQRAVSFLDSEASENIHSIVAVQLCSATKAAGDDSNLQRLTEIAIHGVGWDEEHPKVPGDAYDIACVCALSGKISEALVWLERCIDAGFRDIELLDTDGDLESLRDEDAFHQLKTKMNDSAVQELEGDNAAE